MFFELQASFIRLHRQCCSANSAAATKVTTVKTCFIKGKINK